MIKHDDVELCNCCVCGTEMIGKKTARRVEIGETIEFGLKYPVIGGRIYGRPFCHPCLIVRHIPSSAATPDE